MHADIIHTGFRIIKNAGTEGISPLLQLPYPAVIFRNYTPESETLYGRRFYDFAEGTLICSAGHHHHLLPLVSSAEWFLMFPTDLIRNPISEYPFFSFYPQEALHPSAREKQTIFRCMEDIAQETHQAADRYTRLLLGELVECLLDYCTRYYERQFITRHPLHEPLMRHYESLLAEYIESGRLKSTGFPQAAYFSTRLGLSPAYFSRLIEHETGKSLETHIALKRMEMAQRKLLETRLPVKTIAEELGFSSLPNFCTLFKRWTGMLPHDYRIRN